MDVCNTGAVRDFVRLCGDGWRQGWHERNGGNLSCRLTDEDLEECRPGFSFDRPWTPLHVCDPRLAGAFFLVTGSGKYMRNVPLDPPGNIGVVEIDDTGGAWRTVWGLENGARPSSELDSHCLCHAARAEATGGACRVLYHAHPPYITALTFVLPLTASAFSRAL